MPAAKKQPPKKLDVWLVESNKVYREVPFEVVTDWVRQSRLLAEDRVRVAGKGDWRLVGESVFKAYIPKPEPHQAEDTAEALEPVEAGFSWKKPRHDEDDDVDMIPLIDVSLVLLIFFMMTAGVAASGVMGRGLPKSRYGEVEQQQGSLWIEVEPGPDNKPLYSVGRGSEAAIVLNADDKKNPKSTDDLDRALRGLKTLLPGDDQPPAKLFLRVHGEVPFRVDRDLLTRLEYEPFRSKITVKRLGTSRQEP